MNDGARPQLDDLPEWMSDGFAQLDARWRVLRVNREAERLLGLPRDQVLGRDHWELFPEFTGTPLERHYRHAMAERAVAEFEQLHAASGRWVSIRCSPAGDGGLAVFFRDITAWKDTEARLRDADRQRRLALEAGEIGAWNIDTATSTLVADERFNRMFHGLPSALTYEQAFDRVHPDDAARIRAAVTAAMDPTDPAPYAQEYRVVHPDGTVHWLFGKGRANFSETADGRCLASFDGTVVDITTRKVRDALQDAAERQQAYLATLGERLRSLQDAGDIQIEASTLLGRHLHADRVVYFEIDGDRYTVQRDYAPRVPSLAGTYAVADFGHALVERFRTGRTLVESDTLADPARGALERASFQGIRVRAHIVVPLVKGGELVAGLAVQSATCREWTHDEVALAENTAERTWAAVERARAEDALRASETRLRLLDAIGQATRDAADAASVMATATRMLGEHLGATRCAYADVEQDNDGFTIRDDWTVPGVASTVGTYSLSLFGPRAVADLHQGRALVVRDVDAELAGAGDAMFNAIGIKAIVCCPLAKDGRLRAMMAVHQATPRDWSASDIALVREVAERAWAHIERVRSAVVLQESEARYRSLFTTMDQGFCVIDMAFDASGRAVDFRFIETNPAFESQSGVADAVGRSVRDVVPGYEDATIALYGEVARTGTPRRLTLQHVSLGGRWFDVYAFRLGGHGSTRVAVLFTDVTARRHEEERERQAARDALAAAEANAKFQAFFEQGPYLGALLALDGTLLDANRAAIEGAGHARDAFIGRPFWDLELWPRTDDSAQRIRAAVLSAAEGTAFHAEVPYLHADGSLHALDANLVPVADETGRTLFVAALGSDVTARGEAERERERLFGELQRQDRRKDEFLAMLSHELRNPLAPIGNAVQLLRLHGRDDALQQQAHGIIERQVGQLKLLIDDLLEVSRITTGRVQLRQEHVALGGIVERAIETARPLIDQRAHALHVDIPEAPAWVRGDAARLEQVVVNLLTNAAKYTDAGGRIDVSIARVGADVELRVRDTGVGIAPDLLPRVFDLFTQAGRSLARSEGGLGIGLALVQRLVDLHGGRVDARSTPGAGSIFTVRLPSAPPPALAQDAPVPADAPRDARLRVMVVDDNIDSANTTALLLRTAGHDVRTAYDGRAALALADAFEPDVAVLDIGLPELDGLQVARRLRAAPRHAGMHLVALTGYGQASDRENSRDAGFDHHLVKPADFPRLEAIVASAAHRRGAA